MLLHHNLSFNAASLKLDEMFRAEGHPIEVRGKVDRFAFYLYGHKIAEHRESTGRLILTSYGCDILSRY